MKCMKTIFWDVDLLVITQEGAHIETYIGLLGTRTQAVHKATIRALERNNYNCKLSYWFNVKRAKNE